MKKFVLSEVMVYIERIVNKDKISIVKEIKNVEIFLKEIKRNMIKFFNLKNSFRGIFKLFFFDKICSKKYDLIERKILFMLCLESDVLVIIFLILCFENDIEMLIIWSNINLIIFGIFKSELWRKMFSILKK